MTETTALAKPNRDLFVLLESAAFKKQLVDALPNALTPDRMIRLAITMIKKNSAIAKCDPISIMSCVVETAQLGLEPEGVLGHAYLVPFGGVCTLIIGYRGFAHLMYQSGAYADIGAEVVRSKDQFEYVLGTRREIRHIPADIPADEDHLAADHWRGAYAYCVNHTGATAFAFLQRPEILQARARSKSYQSYKRDGKSSPWITDTAEMWKKTAIRRLAKRSQTSTTDQRPALLRAVMLDEYAERKGLLVPTLAGFEINPNPPDPEPDEEPITPTRELSDSSPSNEGAKKETPKQRRDRERAQLEQSGAVKQGNPEVPKAKIPNTPIDVKPTAAKSEPKKDDPFINATEQTKVYSTAEQNGWKIFEPNEVLKMLTKRFGVDSIRLVRRSQLPKILEVLEAGT